MSMKPAIGVTCLGLLAAGCAWHFGGVAPALPAAPSAPAHYQVKLRYRIVAPRDQHALLYDQLVDHLIRLKFDFEPPLDQHPATDRIDPSKNEFRGKLPASQILKVRDNALIAGVVLVPDGFKLPDAPDQPVRVRIELQGGLPGDRQRDLAEQTKLLLGLLGFKEAPGYDHRGVGGRPYSKLIGTLPTGQLDSLLKDLRTQPSGWLGPRIVAEELPAPLRTVNPIVYTEVLTDPEPVKDASEPAARAPEYLEKIGPGLWELVSDKEKEQTIVRVQVLFAGNPSAQALQQVVQRTAPSSFVESVLGTIVTAQMTVADAKALAAAAEVLGVRLTTPARVEVDPAPTGIFEPAKVVQLSGLADLHKRGKLGQGVRLAMLDTDFRGWEEQVKAGKLPATTTLLDLTAERSTELVPAAHPAGPELGHGTQCALAAAVAAPAADFVLIRIGDDDPNQLFEVQQYLRGGGASRLLDRRRDELNLASSILSLKRNRLLAERKVIFDNFRDEEELRYNFSFLGAAYGWIFSDREWHRQQIEYQEKLERELTAKDRRYWKLYEQVQKLKGIPVAACALAWHDDYPLGGASPLSRAFDSQTDGPLWFQAAGNTGGQAWTGLYRDSDSNGIMEFAELETKSTFGPGSRELNFLTWKTFAGKLTPDMPDKAALRLSLQWREPHDPDYYLPPGEEDPYRRPLAELRLTLLRQRDPEGKTVGADAFDVVARSRSVPGRLDHQPGVTVYEQVLDYTIEQSGRYAVRIERQVASQWTLVKVGDRFGLELREGLTSTGTRPVGAPTLPGLEKHWELRPRLFAQVTNEPFRRQGRPQLAHMTAAGAIGLPADARQVISVGAAALDGRPQPESAAGPPAFVDLAARPTIWAYDAVRQGKGGAWGTSLSAAYAAGIAATLLSAGETRDQVLDLLREQRGRVFRTTKVKE